MAPTRIGKRYANLLLLLFSQPLVAAAGVLPDDVISEALLLDDEENLMDESLECTSTSCNGVAVSLMQTDPSTVKPATSLVAASAPSTSGEFPRVAATPPADPSSAASIQAAPYAPNETLEVNAFLELPAALSVQTVAEMIPGSSLPEVAQPSLDLHSTKTSRVTARDPPANETSTALDAEGYRIRVVDLLKGKFQESPEGFRWHGAPKAACSLSLLALVWLTCSWLRRGSIQIPVKSYDDDPLGYLYKAKGLSPRAGTSCPP